MAKFESTVRVIPSSQEQVYNKLSDLSNLESVKDRLPADKVKDLSFNSDTLSLQVPGIGQLTLKIVDREPSTCIKFETTNSPLPFTLWVQVVPQSEEECKMKLTVDLDVNPFMKAMIQGPLQEGLEKMAEALSNIQY